MDDFQDDRFDNMPKPCTFGSKNSTADGAQTEDARQKAEISMVTLEVIFVNADLEEENAEETDENANGSTDLQGSVEE